LRLKRGIKKNLNFENQMEREYCNQRKLVKRFDDLKTIETMNIKLAESNKNDEQNLFSVTNLISRLSKNIA